MTTQPKPAWFAEFEKEFDEFELKNAAQHQELHKRVDEIGDEIAEDIKADIAQRDSIIEEELKAINAKLGDAEVSAPA